LFKVKNSWGASGGIDGSGYVWMEACFFNSKDALITCEYSE